jgi:GAF domain-containing protein
VPDRGETNEGSATARDRSWLWVLLALVFVVLSPVAAEIARASSGPRMALFVTAQVVFTGLAFLIPQARQMIASRSEATAEERELEARVETRVAMNDALDPILRLLGNLAREPDEVIRNQLRAQAIPLVLLTAAEFIGPDRSRACWFRLEPGPPKKLVAPDAAGRAGSASTTFVEGTPAGDAAIGMVLADEDLLCEDILTDPPPGWDAAKERDYRTFISVSVIAGDTAYGMLTLDALEPGDLDADDKGLLRLMAGVLAVALSVR